MVALISAAGYKWVVDYVACGPFGTATTAELCARWDSPPARWLDYARRLQAAGINLLVRIDPLPGGKYTAPDAPDLAHLERAEAYTRRVIRQLGPYCRHWQIGNEPNLGNESPQMTPEAYVRLMARLAPAMRAEQPTAVIHGPATAMLQCLAATPYPWIDRALAAGLTRHIDVFSFHPYRQGYQRENIPEHASEFHPWRLWGSYDKQIDDLRGRLRRAAGHDVPLASTEDGAPNLINALGEQPISWVVGAKYELRRALLDFHLGVYPRTQFCFYRGIPDPFYESEASFNLVTRDWECKPAYHAARNLHAVLDSSYRRDDTVAVRLVPAEPDRLGEQGARVQVYARAQARFDELLVFYWSTEPASDMHARHRAVLRVPAAGWQAPVGIDLMAMPAPRAQGALIELINPEYKGRVEATALDATVEGEQLVIDPVEVRDYPQLIKWVRPR
ncbi:MAG: hypothetical protein HZB16_16905 [Armatimonadetes bacterium]|nr:hypothetical protein [Armatimonadota bacterium]